MPPRGGPLTAEYEAAAHPPVPHRPAMPLSLGRHPVGRSLCAHSRRLANMILPSWFRYSGAVVVLGVVVTACSPSPPVEPVLIESAAPSSTVQGTEAPPARAHTPGDAPCPGAGQAHACPADHDTACFDGTCCRGSCHASG